MSDDRDVKETPVAQPFGGVSALSNRELLARIADDVGALARKEIELAKAELNQNISKTKTIAEELGVAALLALFGVNMLFVTVALALTAVMPAWGAALLVAGVLLAVAGVVAAIGWNSRVRKPLETTRKHVKEDVKWVKERLA